MTHRVGIWIDHRKATIVVLTADGETLTTIESQVEKHAERGGDSPLAPEAGAGQDLGAPSAAAGGAAVGSR